jgi:hypothetical protein
MTATTKRPSIGSFKEPAAVEQRADERGDEIAWDPTRAEFAPGFGAGDDGLQRPASCC